MKTNMLFTVVLVLSGCKSVEISEFNLEECPWRQESLEATNITVNSWDACLAALRVIKAGKEAELEACQRQYGYERSAFKNMEGALTGVPVGGVRLCDFTASRTANMDAIINCTFTMRAYIAYLEQENRICLSCEARHLCSGKPTEKVEVKSESELEVRECPRPCDQCEPQCEVVKPRSIDQSDWKNFPPNSGVIY